MRPEYVNGAFSGCTSYAAWSHALVRLSQYRLSFLELPNVVSKRLYFRFGFLPHRRYKQHKLPLLLYFRPCYYLSVIYKCIILHCKLLFIKFTTRKLLIVIFCSQNVHIHQLPVILRYNLSYIVVASLSPPCTTNRLTTHD